MADLVLDTNALADLLVQYFNNESQSPLIFSASRAIPVGIARQINQIVRGDGRFIVAASSLAFVELARRWNQIVGSQFEPYQLAAFLQQSPDWFAVEPMDVALIPFLGQVPSEVSMSDGSRQPIEWTDAIHVATTLSRDPQCHLVTTDERLKQVMQQMEN